MTARDRAALSLLGATATGELADAVRALSQVLEVCEVDIKSLGELRWRVRESNGSVELTGWLARDAANLARGCVTLALPVHEIRLDALTACQLGARLLVAAEIWSSEIPLHCGEILRARRAA